MVMVNLPKPMSYKCEACKTRVKDWNGGDPVCGFKTGGFSPDNCNCVTLDKLRLLVDGVQHIIFQYV